jgi:uncharacterized protein YukE
VAGNGFSVDPTALRNLAQRLGALAGTLEQARGITQGIDASSFGAQKLMSASNDFVAHWDWQAKKLGTVLLDTGDRLKQAAQQYQDVEDTQRAMQGQGAAN